VELKVQAFRIDLKDQQKSNLPKAGSQARSLLTELGKTTLVESQSQSPKRAIVLPGGNSATFMYWSCLLAQLV